MTKPGAIYPLQIRNLACRKGDRLLFRGLDCDIGTGDLVRVTGPNGIGKTTLLRGLCGLVPPESGDIFWHGVPIHRDRDALLASSVYIGHGAGLNDRLTPLENLHFACVSAGDAATRRDCQYALKRAGLDQDVQLPVRLLSQGQRRRVALARLELASHRPLWILDEPFTALDVAAVRALAACLDDHCRVGGMVVIVTHQDVPFARPHRVLNIKDWAC